MAQENEIDFGDSIDRETFEQILEMDEDDGDERFSKSIVLGFLEQAEQTFQKMESEVERRDLAALSSLGHFLKGSSATLGFVKVKDQCEKIQHYGQLKNEAGEAADLSPDECLQHIKKSLQIAKLEYETVKTIMNRYYEVA